MSVDEALTAMAKHTKENPTHGYNCACKDDQLRAIRAALTDEQLAELCYVAPMVSRWDRDRAVAREIARRADVRARFIDSIAQSVNASDGRSAEYVANVLLVHQPRLLAEAAIVFAAAEVKLLLAEGEATPVTERTDDA